MPDPQPGEDALIRIAAVGICGSDMHAWAGHDDRRPAPLILGHEVAGEVIAGPMMGKRVTVNPLVTCGTCRACKAGRDNLCPTRQIISMPPREGGFAEMVAMPPENLVEVPDGVPLEKAALAEPLACGWHAVRLGAHALDIPLSEAVCVVQGGGAIGLGAALVLRAQGAKQIIVSEPHPGRRAIVAAQGFEVLNPMAQDAPRDVDFVVDGVGFEATRAAASDMARPGGVIVHVGLGGGGAGLNIRRMTLQEITFIGTYTYTKQDFRDTAAAIFDGSLGPLDWTEQRALTDGAGAFDDIAAGRAATPKIVLIP
ncbi:L-iditol 2-dehydrogenase [Rubricella aquisinus]|uniref:L-iditol 2-dehydrogenase n=2 Tax=Rubricella aquisinus TaxID=2028108 RepID=A0A840WRU9_9RHOB|nr:L-iditol 2-dehydrogenase [Rubricella aquisinus]